MNKGGGSDHQDGRWGADVDGDRHLLTLKFPEDLFRGRSDTGQDGAPVFTAKSRPGKGNMGAAVGILPCQQVVAAG